MNLISIYIYLFADSSTIFRSMSADKNRKNSSVVHYLYGGPTESIETCVLMNLLQQILDQDAFHHLRTEQKLGYVVLGQYIVYNGHCGVAVLIQGEKSAAYLDDRITEYFRGLENTLREMKDEKFDEYKHAIIKGFSRKFESMSDEYVEICHGS